MDAPAPQPSGVAKTLLAILVGLAGAVLVLLFTPYSNFLVGNPYIADSYLPIAAVFPLLVMVLLVNPVLRMASPRAAFTPGQLTLIYGILLAACVPASSGFLRTVPYGLAQTAMTVAEEKRVGEVFPVDELQPSLFPDELGYNAQTPASRDFLLQLPSGGEVPWPAWLGPLLSWGAFALAWWIMMTGMALLVFPQWRRNERLAFPLLALQSEMVADPEPGRRWAPMFRARGFWIAAAIVFVIHGLSGLQTMDRSLAPAVPLSYDIGSIFVSEPWTQLPLYIRKGTIYFVFLGVAFLMTTRVSFSIWFFALAYAIYEMLGRTYIQPFYTTTVRDHRTGASIAYTLGIIWLGRAHWMGALRACLDWSRRDEQSNRDRLAVLLLGGGLVAMAGWQVWAGMMLPWAVLFTAFIFLYMLLITRIVAETGLALVGLEGEQMTELMKLLPVRWFDGASAFLGGALAATAGLATRIAWTSSLVHLLGMDESRPPRAQSRLALGLVIVLAGSLAVGGAAHLSISYGNAVSLNGLDQPVNSFGVGQFRGAVSLVTQHAAGAWDRPAYNPVPHYLFGFALTIAMMWACLSAPRFPFHPVGLIIVGTWYMEQVYVSVFLGWLAKVLVVRYGGARLYTAARPFFFGLILGEALAMVTWALVPVVMIQLGRPYTIIPVNPF